MSRSNTRHPPLRGGRPSRRPSRRAANPACGAKHLPHRPACGQCGQYGARPAARARTSSDHRRELRAALGDPILDPRAAAASLTHHSYACENGQIPTNERLGVPRGLSVLGIVVTETLYLAHPGLHEGQLAKPRRPVVNARALGRRRPAGARLGQHMQASGAARRTTGGRGARPRSCPTPSRPSSARSTSSAGPAWAGRQGHPPAFDPVMEAGCLIQGAGLDWKTSLQELSADLGLGTARVPHRGRRPDHMKTFVARVRVGDLVLGNGNGHSKRRPSRAPPRPAYSEIGPPTPGASPCRTRLRTGRHRHRPLSRARAPRGRGRPRRSRAPRPRRRPSRSVEVLHPRPVAVTTAGRPASPPHWSATHQGRPPSRQVLLARPRQRRRPLGTTLGMSGQMLCCTRPARSTSGTSA